MSYNLNDPEDALRFRINMMVGAITQTINEHIQGGRISNLPPLLAQKFTDMAVAIKALDDATAPKDAVRGR